MLEQHLCLGETAIFVRSAHSCTGMALKQTDIMMNHVHDHAMSNGHLLTPCHVDLNSKDSYMVTIDVIVLMAFSKASPHPCHLSHPASFFVIILAPTC